jgi:hypothetical protein
MGSTPRSTRSSGRREATSLDGTNLGSENTRQRQGFTLFEVAISLAIMGFAVVSVLMVFPLGLKEQQQARARLLAATKTMELIEYFSGKSTSERMAEFETPEPWDTRPFCYTNTRWDLESRLARFDSGIRPLPLDIAKRLDSDGDEIQRLLGEGAYLYYADAAMIPGVDIRLKNPSPPVESNKIIFAVSGYAQNNAVPVLPWKAWPYRAAYPSPPLGAAFQGSRFAAEVDVNVYLQKNYWDNNKKAYVDYDTWVTMLEGWRSNGAIPALPSERDVLMKDVFVKAHEYTQTVNPFKTPTTFDPSSQSMELGTRRTALAEASLAFARQAFADAGIATDYDTYVIANGVADSATLRTLGEKYTTEFIKRCVAAEGNLDPSPVTTKESARTKLGLEVQAWRFVALAAATYYVREEKDTTEPDLSKLSLGGTPLTLDRLRYYHDRCTTTVMRYAASFPYDWTAPRPQARAIMMDQPLFEFDLFTAPRSGTISGSGNVAAAMWRPIPAQRVTGVGMPGVFPGTVSNSTWNPAQSPFAGVDGRDGSHQLWGNAQHFTLTKPFHPRERCRELVFWTADWQSYEDAETAPAAPLDASRTLCHGVHRGNISNYDSRLNGGVSTEDALHLRNPERMVSFTSSVTSLATGSDVTSVLMTQGGASLGADQGGGSRTVLLGIYGADRNRNYVLDRGPVPKSVRMRASQVARFTFYDPRLPITLR